MKNLAICLLLLLGAVGCGDDYVVYETVDTMVCIPKNEFQVTREVTMTRGSP